MNENFSLPETCTVVQSAEKDFDKGPQQTKLPQLWNPENC